MCVNEDGKSAKMNTKFYRYKAEFDVQKNVSSILPYDAIYGKLQIAATSSDPWF